MITKIKIIGNFYLYANQNKNIDIVGQDSLKNLKYQDDEDIQYQDEMDDLAHIKHMQQRRKILLKNPELFWEYYCVQTGDCKEPKTDCKPVYVDIFGHATNHNIPSDLLIVCSIFLLAGFWFCIVQIEKTYKMY
jgi:hypothetical protein